MKRRQVSPAWRSMDSKKQNKCCSSSTTSVPPAVPPAVPSAVPQAVPIAIHEITAGDVVVHAALPQPRAQSQLTTSSNDSILVLANELDDSVVSFASKCSAVCCMNEMEAYQPDQKEVLLQFSKKGRHFSPSSYNKYTHGLLCA